MFEKPYGPHGAEEEQEMETEMTNEAENGGLDEQAESLWNTLGALNMFGAANVGGGAIAQGATTPPQASHNDPLGSWTGVPTDNTESEQELEDETPTQDADDL